MVWHFKAKLNRAITHPRAAAGGFYRYDLVFWRYYVKWLFELTLFRLRHLVIIAVYGKPEITIVLIGRSDYYHGENRSRLEATLSWNLRHIDGEVIYVEWNRLPEQRSDAGWLVKRFPNLRVYVVPPEIHESLSTNPDIPVMEYFAKNVGIRRARTPWICVMNPDVVLGPETTNRLHRLQKEYLYGTNRTEFKWGGRRLSLRTLANHKLHRYTLIMNKEHNYIGDFLLAHRDAWHKARGYDESLTDRRSGCDRRGLAQLYHLGVKPRYIGSHFHLDHPESIVYGVKPHHGESFDIYGNLPYHNGPQWGLADTQEIQTQERVCLLKKT